MQEEVESKTLALIVSGTKLTGRMIQSAVRQYLSHREAAKPRDSPPRGKQTVKQLLGQDQGASSIELTDPSIHQFERIARKYQVDYAVRHDKSGDPPKYLIFFKARDADVLTAALNEYAGRKVKQLSKPSVLEKLSRLRALVKSSPVRKKELVR